MAEESVGAVPEPEARGRTRWGVVTAILALPALLVAGLTVLVGVWILAVETESNGPEKVACADAMAFGRAELPDGARDARCTAQPGATRYEAEFRMPRAGVRDWLAATWPDGPEPRTKGCGSDVADLCLNVRTTEGGGDRTGVGSGTAGAEVVVTYDGPGGAQVRFAAYSL